MKRFAAAAALLTVLLFGAGCSHPTRRVVILSTNDIHAKIQYFPQLAAAVQACRDTVETILVDAGDRWTGNAYVDKTAVPGMPVIALMNRLGYDLGTLGNHEFDHGQAYLGRMLDSMQFPVICANAVSDTCTFPSLPPYALLERNGIRFGFVGAITNYEGQGHPAGNDASFEGVVFPDPQQTARHYGLKLRPQVDVLVLLSHMGDDRDAELLTRSEGLFDLVIGGHTHRAIDTLIGGSRLTQTGKNLANIGITTVDMNRKGAVERIGYELRPLAGYAPDSLYAAAVAEYYADPELNRPVGWFSGQADRCGLANWMASAIARATGAEIGFYHIGGVRLDSIPAGGVGLAAVYDLEPFGTKVSVMKLTAAELRRLITVKYNEETREGHRIDLYATAPYTIRTDTADMAAEVLFSGLQEGRTYRVALPDYVYKNYRGLDRTKGTVGDLTVTDVLFGELRRGLPVTPDNTPRQRVDRIE